MPKKQKLQSLCPIEAKEFYDRAKAVGLWEPFKTYRELLRTQVGTDNEPRYSDSESDTMARNYWYQKLLDQEERIGVNFNAQELSPEIEMWASNVDSYADSVDWVMTSIGLEERGVTFKPSMSPNPVALALRKFAKNDFNQFMKLFARDLRQGGDEGMKDYGQQLDLIENLEKTLEGVE